MEALTNYLAMGGYAAWVWPSYGLATLGVLGIVFFTRRSLRAREREFEVLKSERRGNRP